MHIRWQDSLYVRLLRYSRKGYAARALAAQAAGWLALVGIVPSLRASRATSLTTVGVGALVLVLGLLALGPALNLAQPALARAGQLPGGLWPALGLLGFVAWRQRVGSELLEAAAQLGLA